MNRKAAAAISAVIALTMATGQLAFAQGKGDRDGKDWRKSERRDARGDRHDNRDFGRRHNEERSRGRGVGPNYEYYRGDRLPIEYRHRIYVVDDWRGHRLSAPPRGYHWVQSGGDYILVAIATGIILQILLSH
jgi:Ni/Co efflux regulator RcnB